MKLKRISFAVVVLAAAVSTAITGYATAAGKAPVVPKTGNWAGNAGPADFGFKVTDKGKKVSDMTTHFEGTVNCGPPSNNPPLVRFPTMAVVKGKFHGSTSITYPSGISPRYSVSGTFSDPKHVGGTMNVRFSFPHNALPPCDQTSPIVATRATK